MKRVNYIELLDNLNKNIIKLTNQLKFLNYFNNSPIIQIAGGLESINDDINQRIQNSIQKLTGKIMSLDETIKNYENKKKENIYNKLEDLEQIENINNIDMRNYSYKLIQKVIYKLEKEGNDIMDPNFQNILIKYLKENHIEIFKNQSKDHIIIKHYNFINNMIEKFVINNLSKEKSSEYSFLLEKNYTILENTITPEQEAIRNKLIVRVKEAITLYYVDNPEIAVKINKLIDKDHLNLHESDIMKIDLLSNE